jgi:hypothetical protein
MSTKASRDKKIAYMKAYREANRQKIAASSHAWYEANCEKMRAYSKAYRKANLEKVLANLNAWRAANPEKTAANHKAYFEANCEKITARQWRRALGPDAPPELIAARAMWTLVRRELRK